MSDFVKIYRFVLCGVVLFFSGAVAGEYSIDEVSREFPVVYSKLSRLASQSVSAMSVDSAKMLLTEVQKRIKGVYSILRMNSAGTIINEISPAGTSMPMRSVADQKWFLQVKDNNKPYFGTSREQGGTNLLLFWAWPVQTGSGAFGGVLAVKLDAGPVCSGICNNDSVHFAAFYNENLLFRCGNDRYTFTKEASWMLPDSSSIIFRLGDAATSLQRRAAIQEEKNVDEAVAAADGNTPAAEVDIVKNEGKKAEEEKESVMEIQPKIEKKEKGGLNGLIYIVLCGVIVSGILLVKSVMGKNGARSKHYTEMVDIDDKMDRSELVDSSEAVNTTDSAPESSLYQESVMDTIPEEHNEEKNSGDAELSEERSEDEADEKVEEKVDDETEHHLARETCEKIKAIISDSTGSNIVSSSSAAVSSLDDALRKELYKEIHGQIMHWVTYESTRLSQSLQELSDRVGKLENVNDPEVARIRNEAQRVSKEIASFKDNAAGMAASDGVQI